jgi:hypothetical protein
MCGRSRRPHCSWSSLPDDAAFSVAFVPAEFEDVATPQPCIRSNLDHRPQVPTNLFSGGEQSLVFVSVDIPDNLIIRTEHPNLANWIHMEYALNITPVEERFEQTEIFIDSGFAHFFPTAQLEFFNCSNSDSRERSVLAEFFFDGLNEVSVCAR